MATNTEEGLKDTPFVAEYLHVPLRTVDQWAYRGVGPAYFKIGRHRRYRLADIDAWIESSRPTRHSPTASPDMTRMALKSSHARKARKEVDDGPHAA